MKVTYDRHGHEHEFEPQFGLPEPLPADERILWQGSPDWRMLARTAFHVRKLALYFGAILALRAVSVLADGGTAAEVSKALMLLLPLALLAIAIAAALAWLSSRTCVYTLTDKRVVLRIGIVLSLTFNLPLRRLATAGLRLHADGSGDMPLTLAGTDTIAYLHLWPHARPWRVAQPEPLLRCVPDAARVSALLAAAWADATGLAAARPAPAEPVARTHAAAPVAAYEQGAGRPLHA
jgi:Bacterial PH domain